MFYAGGVFSATQVVGNSSPYSSSEARILVSPAQNVIPVKLGASSVSQHSSIVQVSDRLTSSSSSFSSSIAEHTRADNVVSEQFRISQSDTSIHKGIASWENFQVEGMVDAQSIGSPEAVASLKGFDSIYSDSALQDFGVKNHFLVLKTSDEFRLSSLISPSLIFLGLVINCAFFFKARKNQQRDILRIRKEKISEEFWFRGIELELLKDTLKFVVKENENYWDTLASKNISQNELKAELERYLNNTFGGTIHEVLVVLDEMKNQYSGLGTEFLDRLYELIDDYETEISDLCTKYVDFEPDRGSIVLDVKVKIHLMQYQMLTNLKGPHEALVNSLHQKWDDEDAANKSAWWKFW